MDYMTKVAEAYLKDMDIYDISLLKICLLALGMMIGIALPIRDKRSWVLALVVVFLASYIPLMVDFIPYFFKDEVTEG